MLSMVGQMESIKTTDLSTRELEVCTLSPPDGKYGPIPRMERRPSIVIVDYENEEII